MLLTCALQGGGVMTTQAPFQPVREKTYMVGQSYDTSSGKVFIMKTRVNSSDVTVMTANLRAGQRVLSVSSDDDVITGAPLMTIREVETPTSVPEPLPSVRDILNVSETSGARTPGGRVSGMSPVIAPPSPKSSQDKLNSAPSKTTPSVARVVC